MITFYNDRHARHDGRFEMFRGARVPCFEVPLRAQQVRDELRRRGWAEPEPPRAFGEERFERVHSRPYLDFLRGAWAEWAASCDDPMPPDVLPSVWPVRGHRLDVQPRNFAARLGLYALDAGTPLTEGTWEAARSGAWCALSAADEVLRGTRAAFALTRPPGHHAGRDFFGGYCFLNNAALAAQALRDGGAQRVAILDIDYHHGNGTQTLFYDRADIVYASLHGDPLTEYPFYLGHADETGTGEGRGCNLNLPLPRGTGFTRWHDALRHALQVIAGYRIDAMVVSLGVDTFEGDPISGFQLRQDDYPRVGETLASVGWPTVLVFEGGYALAEVGVNTVNVLDGFRQRAG